MSTLLQLRTHQGPLAIAAGIALLALGIATNQLGALTGFGLIALGATLSLSRKRPGVVWIHLGVYLLLYGLFVGAVLSHAELPATAAWRVLLRLDFAASFLLMVAVCRLSLPMVLDETD